MQSKFVPVSGVEYQLQTRAARSLTAVYLRVGDGATISLSDGTGRVYEESKDAWLHGWDWLLQQGYELTNEEGDGGGKLKSLLATIGQRATKLRQQKSPPSSD